MDTLEGLDADLICLQEVTDKFLSLFELSRLSKIYRLYDKGMGESYRNVFLTKIVPKESGILDLYSNMNRNSPYFTFNDVGREVNVFNVHLESNLEDAEVRKGQIQSIIDFSKDRKFIICGDMNFGDLDIEDSFVKSFFEDPGAINKVFTYDIESNSIAQSTHFKNEGSRRLDRFLIKGNIHYQNYRVVESSCSDHYPILISLDL